MDTETHSNTHRYTDATQTHSQTYTDAHIHTDTETHTGIPTQKHTQTYTHTHKLACAEAKDGDSCLCQEPWIPTELWILKD